MEKVYIFCVKFASCFLTRP